MHLAVVYKLDALLTFFFSITISPSVTPPAVLPTIILSIVEIRCQLRLAANA